MKILKKVYSEKLKLIDEYYEQKEKQNNLHFVGFLLLFLPLIYLLFAYSYFDNIILHEYISMFLSTPAIYSFIIAFKIKKKAASLKNLIDKI